MQKPRFILRAIVLYLITLGGRPEVRGEGAEPRYERAEGSYSVCYLQLESNEVKLWAFVGLRDGVARTVAVKGVRHPFLESDLKVLDGKLAGVVRDAHPVFDAGQKLRLEIEAAVGEDGEIVGTFAGHFNEEGWNFKSGKVNKVEPVEVRGRVAGNLVTAGDLEEEQANASGAEWPQWEGPLGNCVASDTGVTLIDDLRGARLVWKSEAVTPAAPGPSKDIPRTMGSAPFLPYCGGGATPVVGGDKVFLRYTLPSGETFDQELQKRYEDAGLPERALARGRKLLSVGADDVVVCFDARTGALLWRATFPDAGLNFQGHKVAQNNLSALYDEGKLFAVGSTLRFYAHDAETGEVLWERPLGEKHEAMEKAKAAAVKQGKFLGGSYGNRSWGFSPIAAAGRIICNDKAGGLVAFDPETGERVWYAENCASENATPQVWSEGGKDRLLVDDRERIHCLDAATGESLWALDRVAGSGLTVADGLLAFQDKAGGKSEPERACAVFRLGVAGAEPLWRADWNGPDEAGQVQKDQYSDYVRPMITDGNLYLSGRHWTDCYDALTGGHLARIKGEGGVANAGHLMVAHGRLFLNRDGKHGESELAMYTTKPDDFRNLGDPEIWTPPHPNTTSYGPYLRFPVVDGRLFVRGNDAIYCFDLRK